ncbi:MAG TPA: nucleotidyltransferase domain-containing protein [Candidatus Magasanikbacteria bacterium]|uniref:Polymerase III subunit beta protein n=1 Tax=Candidatus Magasanikbacteria bacterium GW2011_GWC2_41_17 TaxID=1619048 RepID=A0A0G0XQY1_9BACT|nr:MAG: polymerase III subunit beta protein [Candidatus Magasanikbacteria bacterium GW2011_GWC2_41_17]HBV58362.1 nucleotidyltransferase domain-containing protein [Candidatus Magasanikbacteria bacterium]HBX16177.1 nucleotidyltransferase domain-containing protein [Candidatus Magasanikbacteria bacterium]
MLRLEHHSAEKLKQELKDIVGRHLDLKFYDIFFFGSRVIGKGNAQSDIDVGIEGAKSVPADALSNIKEEIANLPILYKIEIVDFTNVSPDFKKVAKQKIEKI